MIQVYLSSLNGGWNAEKSSSSPGNLYPSISYNYVQDLSVFIKSDDFGSMKNIFTATGFFKASSNSECNTSEFEIKPVRSNKRAFEVDIIHSDGDACAKEGHQVYSFKLIKNEIVLYGYKETRYAMDHEGGSQF